LYLFNTNGGFYYMNKEERNKRIYMMWDEAGLTYEQIATFKFKACMSRKRVGNIIYGGPGRLKSELEKEVYRIYRLKFLELKDVQKALQFTFENQPHRHITVNHIRHIINIERQKRQVCVDKLKISE